ncbi:MAG: cyclophilin-like fold protein [Roseiflexaceae bacterium]
MPSHHRQNETTAVQIVLGSVILNGWLGKSTTAQDLITLLPLELTFRDFNNVEKIARLPRKLSLVGVPSGADPEPGDIGYYAPSGVIVFYYADVGYFSGIVRLGQFDGSMDQIARQASDFTAMIRLAS